MNSIASKEIDAILDDYNDGIYSFGQMCELVEATQCNIIYGTCNCPQCTAVNNFYKEGNN
jgi:hypothetical protein